MLFFGGGQSDDVTTSFPDVAHPDRPNLDARSRGRSERFPTPRSDRPAAEVAISSDLPKFEEIYEEYFDLVWRVARRLGVPESAAEDVVQDTFIVLHRRLRDYDGRTSIRRWLVGIVVKVAGDHRRRFRRKEATWVVPPSDSSPCLAAASTFPPPNEVVERTETLALLDSLLSELEPSKRELLILAQLEQLSIAEMSEVLGVNAHTLASRLRVARKEFEVVYERHLARVQHMEKRRRFP